MAPTDWLRRLFPRPAPPAPTLARVDAALAPPAPPAPPPAPSGYGDAWVNRVTGLGTSRDKRTAGRFMWEPLSYEECRDMYRGDPYVRRAVNLLSDEATRAGFRLTVSEGDKAREAARWINGRMTDLGFRWKLRQAHRWARAYGGAGILMGIRDGSKSPRDPLRLDRVESVDFLNVLDCDELRVVRWYSSPFHPRYGEPALYQVTPRLGGATLPMGYEYVHASRVLRVNGVDLSRDEEQLQYGWGDSVPGLIFDSLQAFAQGHSGLAHLLTDANQAVFKWKGLAALFKAKHHAEIEERARMIDSVRSLLRAIVVDPEEGFERIATQFSGIPEAVDRLALHLAGALGYPLTVFMGRSPAGLQSDPEADLQSFYSMAMSTQTSELQPHVEQLARILFRCRASPTGRQEPEGWGVRWEPLEILSQKERAELEKVVAEKDAIYVGVGVYRAEEVALSRHGGEDGWSMDTTLDLELREQVPPLDVPEDAPTLEPVPKPAQAATAAEPPATPGAPAQAGAPLAATALNGAQVASAQGIVQSVADRKLPRGTGVAMLARFFNLPPTVADEIMGEVGRSFFTTSETAPAADAAAEPAVEPPAPAPKPEGTA